MSPKLEQGSLKSPGRQKRPPATSKLGVRRHHYEFAHVALRNTFFSRTRPLAAAMISRREGLLHTIWSDVGDAVAKREGQEAKLPPDGLALATREIKPLSLLFIVSLPPAEGPTEAYFVGMAVKERRFFTLERGLNPLTGDSYTVLCEWTGAKHVNYGQGPEATVDAFAAAVSALIKGKARPTVRGSVEPGGRDEATTPDPGPPDPTT